uniref:Uncharacterized protein n=1 Tax=viral metagenome TaxID=1070528 RepID=A0A6C0JQA5_9ZZZZ
MMSQEEINLLVSMYHRAQRFGGDMVVVNNIQNVLSQLNNELPDDGYDGFDYEDSSFVCEPCESGNTSTVLLRRCICDGGYRFYTREQLDEEIDNWMTKKDDLIQPLFTNQKNTIIMNEIENIQRQIAQLTISLQSLQKLVRM